MSIIVETFKERGSIRVRPAPGGRFPQTMRVCCSREMRSRYPVGARFRILVQQVNREGERTFLYSHPDWEYEVVED